MAAVTIHSDFRVQENKICPRFHFFSYLPWSDGTGCYDQCILLAKLYQPLPCFILYSKAKFACYWPKSNPLQLYSESDKYIQGIRSDRVPEELWMELHNIVQEAVIKKIYHLEEKEMQKAKLLSKEALQTVEKKKRN